MSFNSVDLFLISNRPSFLHCSAATAMHDQTSLLAPLSVFLARRGGSGDRILFRYPFADPKPNAGSSMFTLGRFHI